MSAYVVIIRVVNDFTNTIVHIVNDYATPCPRGQQLHLHGVLILNNYADIVSTVRVVNDYANMVSTYWA